MTELTLSKPREEATEAVVMAKDWQRFPDFQMASLCNCTILRSKVARAIYVLHHPTLKVFRSRTAGSTALTGCKLSEIISEDREWIFAALMDGTVTEGRKFIEKEKGMIATVTPPRQEFTKVTAKPPVVSEWEKPKVKTKRTKLVIEEEEGETTISAWQLQRVLKTLDINVPDKALETLKAEQTPDGVKLTWKMKDERFE